MTAQLIDGNALSKQIRAEVAQRAAALTARGVKPGLAVILVGDNPASQVYVRNKVKACEDSGLHSVLEKYDASLTEAELLARIDALNNDPAIHGILVQLPLPKHIDDHKVIEAISPAKDVDGFHVSSAGALMVGEVGFKACTPYGCMKMLESIGMKDLRGKHAVVIGRSDIVGKPMAMMLLHRHATVTICHSRTRDLPAMAREADILIAAIGRTAMITGDYVREGAVVVDVGMNSATTEAEIRQIFPESEWPKRLETLRKKGSTLVGDVEPRTVIEKAAWLTPVPGGVGPLTIAMLMQNTLRAAEMRRA